MGLFGVFTSDSPTPKAPFTVSEFKPQYLDPVHDIIQGNIGRFTDIRDPQGEAVYFSEQIDAFRHYYSPDTISENARTGHLYVAFVNDESGHTTDKLVGVGGYTPRRNRFNPLSRHTIAQIACAHVDPEFQNQRVFKYLMRQVVGQAYREGIERLEGFAVLDTNVEDMYRKLGCDDDGLWERDFDGSLWVPQRKFSVSPTLLYTKYIERKKHKKEPVPVG